MRKVKMIPVLAISIAAIFLFTLPATKANCDNKPAAAKAINSISSRRSFSSNAQNATAKAKSRRFRY